MPTNELSMPELSTPDKMFGVAMLALVASYAGGVISSRRLLKKSLEESNAQYRQTSEQIADIIARHEMRPRQS